MKLFDSQGRGKFSFHGHTMKQNRVGNSDELDENWNAQFSGSLNGEKLRACVCVDVCVRMCTWACLCAREKVSICVCVFERERVCVRLSEYCMACLYTRI